MTTVNEAIETLTHAFGDFKTSQEARLHHLELAHKRPAFENNGGFLQAETAQKKALLNYVRQGEAKHLESMEIKNLTNKYEEETQTSARRSKNFFFLKNVMDQHLTHLDGLITFKQPFNNQE